MPDLEIRPRRCRDERGADFFERLHERVWSTGVDAICELVREFTVLWAVTAFRGRAIGSENVPLGPVIAAPVHALFMDHCFTGALVRRRIGLMAKSQPFTPWLPRWAFSHGGALGMYCEGRSRTGQIGTAARPGHRGALRATRRHAVA